MNASDIILTLAAVLSALIAGLFFAWSCSVMPGFARLSDKEFVAAMQATNRAIQNPVFFAAFFGAPIFLIISVIFHYGKLPRFALLLGASAVYMIGVFAVTGVGNIPLNNNLDRFDSSLATDHDIQAQRASFERLWNNLNIIRTVSSIVALILVVIACLN